VLPTSVGVVQVVTSSRLEVEAGPASDAVRVCPAGVVIRAPPATA
jgi:hypothetical protein